MLTTSRIIIGLVGHPSSGKDTVSDYLVRKYGFVSVAGGDIVREYVAKHTLGEPKRDLLREVAKKLRAEHGPDYLIRLTLENSAERLVANGVRAVAEAEAVKRAGGTLLAVIASQKRRYERARARGRVGENVTFNEFVAIEQKEARSNEAIAQSIDDVIARADYTLHNDGTIEELYAKVDEFLRRAGYKL